uniref:Uncharacterized protein n=1 Tax=Anguilla anguilla TaxID=7936 RepID=A0A0E9S1C8_ANGAN
MHHVRVLVQTASTTSNPTKPQTITRPLQTKPPPHHHHTRCT